MHRSAKNFSVASTLAVVMVAGAISHANAFGPRVPQVPVLGGTLQAYLNSKGESINVLTDQQDAQVWSQSASGNALLTLMVELTGNAPLNTVGVYNASLAAPPLYQIFPGAATAGWFAVMSFRTAPVRMVVNLFDDLGTLQGNTTYLGVDPNSFGFYIAPVGGPVLYSQDYRNPGGAAQMLAYQGTGINFGEWWLCFEEAAVSGGASDRDYDDAVLILESVNPLPAQRATLGGVKALYR
jgi:hypothetical protein